LGRLERSLDERLQICVFLFCAPFFKNRKRRDSAQDPKRIDRLPANISIRIGGEHSKKMKHF
jgi:hypothetical protein